MRPSQVNPSSLQAARDGRLEARDESSCERFDLGADPDHTVHTGVPELYWRRGMTRK